MLKDNNWLHNHLLKRSRVASFKSNLIAKKVPKSNHILCKTFINQELSNKISRPKEKHQINLHYHP